MKNEKKIGLALSYLNIVLGTVINLILTPILIVKLSPDSYSIYKVMHSFVGPISMLNLGFSTIVARVTAKYQKSEEGSVQEKENVFATSIVISAGLALLAVMLGSVLLVQVPVIYGKGYSPEQLHLAQTILRTFVFSGAVHIMTDPFAGCIIGNERFAAHYGLSTLRYLIKLCLTLVLLHSGAGAAAVANVDLLNNIIVLAGSMVFSLYVLKEKPKFHYFDKKELYGIFTFGIAIILQTFINQINNNMDLAILGAFNCSAGIITMYSAALTIYTVYNSVLSVFSTIFFPHIAKTLSKISTPEQLTDMVIRPGRIQAAVAIAVISVFMLFGKDFIGVWIGDTYTDAYYVAMILMIPVTIPLVQNACISILDAKLKRLFRSVVLFFMALLNFGVSVVLVRRIGYIGATIGTALSLLIGHGIIMNVYYAKALGIQVFRMFAGIFHRILPTGILTTMICCPLALHSRGTILWFVLECIVFVLVYMTLLWKLGLTEADKKFIIDEK